MRSTLYGDVPSTSRARSSGRSAAFSISCNVDRAHEARWQAMTRYCRIGRDPFTSLSLGAEALLRPFPRRYYDERQHKHRTLIGFHNTFFFIRFPFFLLLFVINFQLVRVMSAVALAFTPSPATRTMRHYGASHGYHHAANRISFASRSSAVTRETMAPGVGARGFPGQRPYRQLR